MTAAKCEFCGKSLNKKNEWLSACSVNCVIYGATVDAANEGFGHVTMKESKSDGSILVSITGSADDHVIYGKAKDVQDADVSDDPLKVPAKYTPPTQTKLSADIAAVFHPAPGAAPLAAAKKKKTT